MRKQKLCEFLKCRFLGILRNILPLSVFTVLVIVLRAIAMLPIGLALYVFGPSS